MRYIKIFETYKSQKAIEKLSHDIFTKCSENTFKNVELFIKWLTKQGDEHNELLKNNNKPHLDKPIGEINTVYLESDFIGEKDKYDVLSGFMRLSQTYIKFLVEDKNNTVGSGYFKNDYGRREIVIFYEKWVLDKLNDEYNNGDFKENSVYWSLISDKLKKVLSHELQHAYDDWRSKGKALVKSDEYLKNKQRKNDILQYHDVMFDSSLTEEESEFLRKQHKDYMNLGHEIDARFTAAIADNSPIKMDTYKKKTRDLRWHLEEWDEYYRTFKLHFGGWKDLSDRDKRRIQRRLSQFYEFDREEVKRKNKERDEFLKQRDLNEGLLKGKSKDTVIDNIEKMSVNDRVEHCIRYSLLDHLPRDKNGRCKYVGYLSVSDCGLKKLPDNLTVVGDFDISHNELDELPKGLSVNGSLECGDNNIKILPSDLYTEGITIYNNPLEKLPENYTIKGNLDISNISSETFELPDNLTIIGDLYATHSKLTKLPNKLKVHASCMCQYNNISEIPTDIFVNGNFILDNNNITTYPTVDMNIKGSVSLKNNNISELPDNLLFKGNLDLSNNKLSKLPEYLTVDGILYTYENLVRLETPSTAKITNKHYK